MAIREYEFVAGVETPTLPTVSDPSGDGDLVTKGYADKTYAHGIATVADVKAIATAARTDNLPIFVDALQAWFYFDSASAATGDDILVITPTAGTGRWIRIGSPLIVDNLQLSGNTIASRDTNGNLNLEPDGTGLVRSTKKSAWTGAMKVGEATAPVATALLEMVSTTQGFLPPRMTTAERDAIVTPAEGLVIYNTDDFQLNVFADSEWSAVGAGGGGGGGGGFQNWFAGVSAPQESIEFDEKIFLFSNTSEELYQSMVLPDSYVAGTQVFVYVSGYSPSTSNTILLQGQSTLIRKDTDANNSTTNQRTTTNSALTNTVANMHRQFILDISDSSGQINGVALSPGDRIKVRLYRGADTDTAELRFLPLATGVKS